MSAKGALIEALQAYTREVRNTPGQQDLTAQLEELRRQIDEEPDPAPGGPPPIYGQTKSEDKASDTPGTHIHVSVSPEKSAALGMLKGA